MRKYSIQAPTHRKPFAHGRGQQKPHSQTEDRSIPQPLSDTEKAALVARYFVPFSEVMPKWEERLKAMKLTRLHLPFMCRKLSSEERTTLDMAEIKTWFFNRSGLDSQFSNIERKKAAIFDALLTRVEEAIAAGETFALESSVSQRRIPKRGSRTYQVSREPAKVRPPAKVKPEYIDFTSDMRLRLRDAFMQGNVTLVQIHRHMVEKKGDEPVGLSLGGVYRWFNDNAGVVRTPKNLLSTFLSAAISLMEEKVGKPAAKPSKIITTGQTDLSDYQPELHPVQ